MQFTFKSIGTTWWIEIYDQISESKFKELQEQIHKICNEFEENYSRFKETSFISILNNRKQLENFPKEMFEMFLFAKKANRISHGSFNPAITHVLENIGYDKDYSFEVKNEKSKILDFSDALINVSEESIQINEAVKIDFGGFGKGWLVDKVSNFLKERNIKYFYVNAGGDIYATSNFENEIEFALENPFDLTEKIGSIKIKNKSIASSSINRRFWIDQTSGKTFNHIINPATQNYNSEIAATFIEADTSLISDTASTSIFTSDFSLISEIAKDFECEFLIIFQDQSYIKSSNYSGQMISG